MRIATLLLALLALTLPTGAAAQGGNPFGPVSPPQQPAPPPTPTVPEGRETPEEDGGIPPALLFGLIGIGLVLVGATLYVIIRGARHDEEVLHPKRDRKRRKISRADASLAAAP